MKKLRLALVIGLFASILISNFREFEQCIQNLEDNVLRLHIIANSDSDEDQELKLQIRDRLLEYSEEIFDGIEGESLCAIEEKLSAKLEQIKEIAEDVIEENGFSYEADCKLVSMYFDAKNYDNITMPAGTYDALRITIGEAKGKNWWCVMYPPLCIPAAEKKVAVNDDEDKDYAEDAKSDKYLSDGFETESAHEGASYASSNGKSGNDGAASSNGKSGNDDISTAEDASEYFTDDEYDILTNTEKYQIKFKIVEVYNDIKNKIKNF